MLTKMILTMKKEADFNINASSLLHGALMELLNPEYATYLHSLSRTPYTQYMTYDENYIYWHITTTEKTAREQIIERLRTNMPHDIFIKHKNILLEIVDYRIEDLDYDELMEKTYFNDCPSTLSISFLTPTAFKVDGKYQFYPTVYHIFYSLINKYDAVAKDSCIFSDEIMEQITEHVEISGYRLASCTFQMEGVRIKGFKGRLTLKLHGPRQFISLINMLLRFGEYSGVGIKTSLGMGAVSIEIPDNSRTKTKIREL